MNKINIHTIILSRTDAIGDVVLTLPMATIIKNIYGDDTRVIFFGRKYTFPVIGACDNVDDLIDYDIFERLDNKDQADFLKKVKADAIVHVFPRNDIAKAAKHAGIPERIGTTNRLYHWYTCNRLVRVARKNSSLHEALLNIELLKPLGYKENITTKKIPSLYHFNKIQKLPEKLLSLLDRDKFHLILHPKSNASAREWKMDHYRDLIRFLPPDKFQIIITGSEKEVDFIGEWKKNLPSYVLNLTGKLSLDELIALINSCDGLIAASTGPLHISAALGKYTLGIFPPIRPMSPVRWAPLGEKAEFLVVNKKCSDCRNNPHSCYCINDITPQMAEERVLQWRKNQFPV